MSLKNSAYSLKDSLLTTRSMSLKDKFLRKTSLPFRPLYDLNSYCPRQLELGGQTWWFQLEQDEWEEKNSVIRFLSEWHWGIKTEWNGIIKKDFVISCYRLWQQDFSDKKLKERRSELPMDPGEEDLCQETISIILGKALAELEMQVGNSYFFSPYESLLSGLQQKNYTATDIYWLLQGQIIAPEQQYFIKVGLDSSFEQKNNYN